MDYSVARRLMVDRQLKGRGIKDAQVLAAMLEIPRHLFVEEALRSQSYGDFPLPIGEKQTISQPFMVAFMTEALQLTGRERVLEIGTGSGYQSAVLARLADRVYSLERIPELARRARKVLDTLGCSNVHLRVADGSVGWEEAAPFDGILVTAGAPEIPSGFLSQLADGGRLVIPVGPLGQQTLLRVTKEGAERFRKEELLDCRFVPLIGIRAWHQEEV